MDDLLRERTVQEVVAAVRDGQAGGLFPLVTGPGPDGTLRPQRQLRGEADAEFVGRLLRRPRYQPLVELLIELDTWCEQSRRRFGALIGPEVLRALNADLFGPLVSEAFLGHRPNSDAVRRQLANLGLFLERLERDSRSRWFTEPAFALPVVGLRAHDGETHNGRQRVLRLDLRGGGRLAYKPRPANGEELFLAGSSSVFGLLNRLPPTSGEIRLPTLRHLAGDGPYSWQEWIEPPAEWGIVRREGQHELSGTRLESGQAGPFWHRSGSLAAACFGFGITDLCEGNLVTGPSTDGPMYYPIDVEIYYAQVHRLRDTGLVADAAAGDHHHPGLENVLRWCTVDGPAASFVELDGQLELRGHRQAFGREQTRTVVVDADGRAGYGPYLTSFLRGMFDAWTLMCQHRGAIRHALDRPGQTRVLLRSTSDYLAALDDLLLSGEASLDLFDPSELEQLRRLDVPYFYRSARGGPLLHWDPIHQTAVETAYGSTLELPPIEAVRSGAGFTLSRLGAALRDAVAYVRQDLDEHNIIDETHGVRIAVADAHTGRVSFDWAGRRITYSWDHSKLRLGLQSLDELADIAGRLLRLDQVDSVLRDRWLAGGFTDAAMEHRLRVLTGSGATWLRTVIAEHGWPGRTMVGAEAAAAASRLVQHLDDQVPFQRDCLEHLRAAAATGDVPWQDVAYLTDTIRLLEGEAQVYGTKFRNDDGRLVPYPIEQPDGVDERRSSMGLEPLSQYALRMQERFPEASR